MIIDSYLTIRHHQIITIKLHFIGVIVEKLLLTPIFITFKTPPRFGSQVTSYATENSEEVCADLFMAGDIIYSNTHYIKDSFALWFTRRVLRKG